MTTAPPTTPEPLEPGTSTEALSALLQARYSCRGFRPEPLPRATIERIAALAQRTASWCNAQPWQVFIASGAAATRLGDSLITAARERLPPNPDFNWPTAYPGVFGERRRRCGFALYDSVGIARGDRDASARQALENYRWFGAPHVAIIGAPAELGVYGAIDCGAWVAQFMLAATSLGVASIAQASAAAWPDRVRACLEIPAGINIVCAVSFGLADPAHPANGFRTEREPLDQVLRWRDD